MKGKVMKRVLSFRHFHADLRPTLSAIFEAHLFTFIGIWDIAMRNAKLLYI